MRVSMGPARARCQFERSRTTSDHDRKKRIPL